MSRQRQRRVMIFSDDDARRQLLRTGRVLTARAERKSDRPVWVTDERGGSKICDAYRSLVARFDGGGFHEFARSSLWASKPRYRLAGFDSAAAWVQAVRELQGGELPDTVYVHEVVVEPQAASVQQTCATTDGGNPSGRHGQHEQEIDDSAAEVHPDVRQGSHYSTGAGR